MGGFSVVEGAIRTIWMPVNMGSGASTCYEGQLVVAGVAASGSGGCIPWNVAGVGDTTADQVPFGVVVGLNNKVPLYNSTYKSNYGTAVNTKALQVARDWRMAEGMFAKGDPALMAQVAVIGPNTVLKGRIFNAAYGTAPTVLTATAVNGTAGLGWTSNAAEFTPVAYNNTFYCRSGANRGLYRTGYDTSATAHTFYLYWPYTLAVGDTFVGSNLALGTCTGMFDTLGMYINNAAAVYTTNFAWMDVLELNLETAGAEYAIFKLNAWQFCGLRSA